jgi:hypothetical protein
MQPGDRGNFMLLIILEPTGHYAVDAELQCTKEQADALSDLLTRWIASAKECAGESERQALAPVPVPAED